MTPASRSSASVKKKWSLEKGSGFTVHSELIFFHKCFHLFHVYPCLSVVRVNGQRIFVLFDGLFKPSGLGQRIGQIVVGGGKFRCVLNGLPEMADRFIHLSLPDQNIAQAVIGFYMIWMGCQDFLEMETGLFKPVERHTGC